MKDVNKIIDLEKYPVHDPSCSKYKKLVDYTRKQLNDDGCCVLSNFINEDSIKRMKDEAERNLEKVHWTKDSHNPYFTKDDELSLIHI